MRLAWLAPVAFSALAGCASLPDDDPDCTNIISIGGAQLKFCQSHRELDIFETGVTDPMEIESVRVIDDPQALKNLQANLPLRSLYRRSRRIIAKACVVNDDTYITMKVTDFKRIMAGGQ